MPCVGGDEAVSHDPPPREHVLKEAVFIAPAAFMAEASSGKSPPYIQSPGITSVSRAYLKRMLWTINFSPPAMPPGWCKNEGVTNHAQPCHHSPLQARFSSAWCAVYGALLMRMGCKPSERVNLVSFEDHPIW